MLRKLSENGGKFNIGNRHGFHYTPKLRCLTSMYRSQRWDELPDHHQRHSGGRHMRLNHIFFVQNLYDIQSFLFETIPKQFR